MAVRRIARPVNPERGGRDLAQPCRTRRCRARLATGITLDAQHEYVLAQVRDQVARHIARPAGRPLSLQCDAAQGCRIAQQMAPVTQRVRIDRRRLPRSSASGWRRVLPLAGFGIDAPGVAAPAQQEEEYVPLHPPRQEEPSTASHRCRRLMREWILFWPSPGMPIARSRSTTSRARARPRLAGRIREACATAIPLAEKPNHG